MKDRFENIIKRNQTKIRAFEEQRDFFKKKYEDLQSEKAQCENVFLKSFVMFVTSWTTSPTYFLLILLLTFLPTLLFFYYQ